MISTLSGDDLARFAAAHHAYQERLSRVARERERQDAETLRHALSLSRVNDEIAARYGVDLSRDAIDLETGEITRGALSPDVLELCEAVAAVPEVAPEAFEVCEDPAEINDAPEDTLAAIDVSHGPEQAAVPEVASAATAEPEQAVRTPVVAPAASGRGGRRARSR